MQLTQLPRYHATMHLLPFDHSVKVIYKKKFVSDFKTLAYRKGNLEVNKSSKFKPSGPAKKKFFLILKIEVYGFENSRATFIANLC